MLQYFGEPHQEPPRDVVRELDAGELDEDYFVRHAPDYAGQPVVRGRHILMMLLNRLMQLGQRRVASPNLCAMREGKSNFGEVVDAAKSTG